VIGADVFKYRFYFCYQWITVFEILLSRVERYHNTLVLEGESVYDQIVKAVLQFKISSLMTVERKLAGIRMNKNIIKLVKQC
jgi:hypothetical protein